MTQQLSIEEGNTPKVSDCCGVPAYSNDDADTEDIGICPECKEHCEYIYIEDEQDTQPKPLTT